MFCGNCGKKLEDGDNFCPACGAPVHRAASPEVPVTTSPVSTPHTVATATAAATPDKNVEQALLAGSLVLAFGVVLVMLSGNILSFLVDAAIAGGSYFLGYQKFKEGKLKEAKTNSLVFGLIAAGAGILSAGQGNMLLLLIDSVTAGLLIYASSKL